MSKPVCLVTAPVATRSGYGAHSRDIVRALIELDRYDVKIYNVRWGNTPMNALDTNDDNDKMIIERLLPTPHLPKQPEIHIHIVIPNEFQPIAKYNIGITAGLETTACPAAWIEGLNRMNVNFVPSTFVKEVVEKTVFDVQDERTKQVTGELRTNKPIEVLFEGTDTNIYKKTTEFSPLLVDEMKKVDDTFNFLFVGHWLAGGLGKDRKDVGMLLKVFYETFKNDKRKPGLILKTSGAGFSVLDREAILGKIESVKSGIKGELPNVYLMHGDFSDEQMNELYNHPKVKAHINLTHGEGFGRPLLESTMSKKPVIASDWSGHKDFLPKDLAILLQGHLTDVPKESFPKDMHINGAKWFTANYQQTSAIMRDVFVNYKKYKINAEKLTMVNKSKFSLKQMTKDLGVLLDKYVPEFPKEVKLELPKLKKVGASGAKGDTGDTKPPTPEMKLPKLKRV